MSKIKLYIATSLDGYIAREDGRIDWLENFPNPNQIDYGYAEFYASIDTVVMGKNTYEEILGFDVEWPYSNCQSLIVTSDKSYQVNTERTEVMHEIDAGSILDMKTKSTKDIWLVGGGGLVSSFLGLGEIDEMIVTLIPVVLGGGIPLFPKGTKETMFQLVDCEKYNSGVVILTYSRH